MRRNDASRRGRHPNTPSSPGLMQYYDPEEALLDRQSYSSPSLFRREIANVFASSWLFAGPAAWVAGAGEFLTTCKGTERVIVWRTPSGTLRVFDDACPICLRPLAWSDRGVATAFVCPCSARRYGEAEARTTLCRGKLDVWGDLLFAGPDEGPTLIEAVGDFAPYLRRLTNFRVVGDSAVRWRVGCNWKLAVESGCAPAEPPDYARAFQAATASGAAAFGETALQDEGVDGLPGLTPLAGALFPNLTFEPAAMAMHVWHPVARDVTEAHSYCVAPNNGGHEAERNSRRAFMLAFGAGDAARGRRMEAWSSITRAAAGPSGGAVLLNLQAGRRGERSTNLPGIRGQVAGETNARAFYGWWQARLRASGAMSARDHTTSHASSGQVQ